MSPRENAKNGRICAHGLNCKIFVNSELIFEIYAENYSRKKLFSRWLKTLCIGPKFFENVHLTKIKRNAFNPFF